jgi:PAS domain S-box-containing protein
MLWSALRFGTTGVSTSAIAIAVLALWGAAHDRGPFIESQLLHGALSLQLFLFFTAAPFMVLAAVVEENRQANEQLFRSIFENARIGIGIFNIQTGEHFTNRATHEILGYSQEELSRTEQWDEIVHSDDRVSGTERYAELVEGKHDKDEWEQRFIRCDGHIVIANVTCTLIRDPQGKPKYVVTLNEDITERRRAETERVKVTKQMQLLLDSTGQGVYGLDLDGKCEFINKATCEMIGYRPEEVLGRNMHELVHHHKPDGSPYPVEECPVFLAVKNGKGCRTDEEILWRRDGTAIPVEYSSFPILEEGTIKGAVVTASDITERRRAADALAASEQLFHTVFDNAQIAIGILNTKTGKHVNNRALYEMLGYSQQELSRTEQWDEIVHADDRASGAQRYAALVQGKADKDAWEQRYIRRDGKVVIGDCRFKLVRDAVGEPHYVVGLSEDVTEHRRAEKELREAHETLAQQLLAINNELELARQTQLSILPKDSPHLPGLEIAARYMPMSAVAGDFYDFLVVDEKHVGILIADVSGHGLSAALVASMLKSALPAQLPHASDPARVLSGLNQALFGKFETHYVTAAYVFLDMANNTVSYAGAAHPPLLWWHAKTQQTSECLENGVMLGPFLDSTYSAITFTLEKGDEIILVTDGILEATDSSGDQFGMDRLRRTVESNHALSANTFADALLVGLSTWSESTIGPNQTDDITLIVAGFQACS